MTGKVELIARVIACLLALFLFVVLALCWAKRDLHKAVFGLSDWPPPQMVAAIRYFSLPCD